MDKGEVEEPTLEELTAIENCLIEASNHVFDLETRESEYLERLDMSIDTSLRIVQAWKELYNDYSSERPE